MTDTPEFRPDLAGGSVRVPKREQAPIRVVGVVASSLGPVF